jgi:hypothetical protein
MSWEELRTGPILELDPYFDLHAMQTLGTVNVVRIGSGQGDSTHKATGSTYSNRRSMRKEYD